LPSIDIPLTEDLSFSQTCLDVIAKVWMTRAEAAQTRTLCLGGFFKGAEIPGL
jgi:hypothetical protein